jgi:hypothetical protein
MSFITHLKKEFLMKKRWLFSEFFAESSFLVMAGLLIALIAALSSCSNPADGPSNNPNSIITFDNSHGICTAVVYADSRRRDQDKIAEISAGQVSPEIKRASGASVTFYFSYLISLKGISDFNINYVPEMGKDQKVVRIDANKTTNIEIPRLDEAVSSSEQLLSSYSHLLILNNFSYSLELYRGTTAAIRPDNSPSSPVVNTGERAHYVINPGVSYDYRLRIGTEYRALTGAPFSFEAGRVYSFIFDGTASMVLELEIKMRNVDGFSGNYFTLDTPDAPVVTPSPNLLTLQWTAVEGIDTSTGMGLSANGEPPYGE